MSLPLSELLVVDFTRVLAGPYATMMLADLGARVIKIERPHTGDDTRQWGPPWTKTSSSYFEATNRNKESIALSLDRAADREIAQRLAARADVVIENFRSSKLQKYGLDYATVKRENEDVIYCSITGFGDGKGKEVPGYDLLIQAVGGLMSITGIPDEAGGSPQKVGTALVDILAGKDAVIGILAAVKHRSTTGCGQLVRINLLSSLLAALGNQATSYLTTGISPSRYGNAHPSIAPYDTFTCRDGPLVIACGNDRQFHNLVSALGKPELATDPRFLSNSQRVQHQSALTKLLNQLLATKDSSEWSEQLLQYGIPAGKVSNIHESFQLAETLGLEPTVNIGPDHPKQVRHPVLFSATPVNRYDAPPTLDQNGSAIREWIRKDTQYASR